MSSSLLHALFWAAVLLVVVGQIAILYSTFRAVPAARAAGKAPAVETSPRQRALETLWAWLPVAMLAIVLLLTWRAIESPTGAGWRLLVPEGGGPPVVLPVAPPAGRGA